MRLKLALSMTTAALLAAMASPGHATVLPYKNVDALVNEADGIVIGTVRSVQASASKPHDVHTYVTLDHLEVLSGRLNAPTLTLRVRGGLVDGRGLHVDGAPSFAPNERVLLFVQGNGKDLVPLVGWGQGMFRLVPDAATGKTKVQDAEGHDIVGMAEGHVQRREGDEMDVVLLGAPEMTRARTPKPEMHAGQTDDGSPSTTVQVQAMPARAMSADRFVAEMRQRAAGHAGKALRSVTPQDVQTEDAGQDAAAPNQRAARQPVAMPEGGGVSLPLPRSQPAVADQR
ncbi:hypothetical protein AACH06_08485 [Ideonella sp. DXS29W]|uniref:Uncharacterized protein n=1 Tax=Ideonella lacteola TaxID=2984193 RepID=A0ABU9BLM5_9BURK